MNGQISSTSCTVTLLAAMMVIAFCSVASAADRSVVINELMYHPPNDRDDLQYVELFNPGKSAVPLTGCKFTKGISFFFPDGATVGPGEFVVVCRNREAFSSY